jgi:hypothetical protein
VQLESVGRVLAGEDATVVAAEHVASIRSSLGLVERLA